VEGRYSFNLEAVDRAGLTLERNHPIVIDMQSPTSKVDTPSSSEALASEVGGIYRLK